MLKSQRQLFKELYASVCVCVCARTRAVAVCVLLCVKQIPHATFVCSFIQRYCCVND